jgi:quercetin dioxygenase-like cupin family protein
MKIAKLLFLCAFLFPGVVLAEDKGIKVEQLLKADTSWDGVPYKKYPEGKPELSVLKITIPPHTKMQWHTHPMPNVAYVLSGELTVVKKDTGETKNIKAGEVLPETIGTVHRGMTEDSPAVLIVFYAGNKGMPLSQIVK